MKSYTWLNNYNEIDLLISEALDEISDKLPVYLFDKIGIILLALVKRIVSNYNATKLLYINGFTLESFIIIRSIIESVIVFNALIDNPDVTFDKLFKLSNSNKFRIHKMALENKDLRANAINYDFSGLETSNVKIKEFVDLSSSNKDLYEIGYRIVSNTVHINLFSIESFLIINIGSKFSLKENINDSDVESAYFTLEFCLFLILSGLNRKYNFGIDEKIAKIEVGLELLN